MKPFLRVDNNLKLHLARPEFAIPLFELIQSNRNHLRRWLPWVDTTLTEADTEKFITESIEHNSNGTRLVTLITYREQLLGSVSVVQFNKENQSCDIGYWLSENFQGKGFMTKACSALIEYLFNSKALNKIRIQVASGNTRSKGIPEKLGFKKEGLLRQEILINNAFYDSCIYGLLKEEWRVPAKFHN